MKYKEFLKREAINWVIILMPFIYILLVYNKLPRFAPLQMNSEQTIYHKVIFVMGFSFITYFIFLVRPAIVPKTAFQENLKSYHKIRTLFLGFFSLSSMIFVSEKIGIPFNWPKIAFIISMVFITVIGNLYPTLKNKYLFGIKNSWTRSSELIWKKTQSFAGKVFFWGGLLGVLYGVLFDVSLMFDISLIKDSNMTSMYIVYLFILQLIPTVYSYLLFRKIKSHAH